MEGGYVYGHDSVRAYWTRQWGLIDPIVEPQAFGSEPDGRIVVEVRQRVSTKTVVRSLTGKCATSTASETDSCGTWRYATLARG